MSTGTRSKGLAAQTPIPKDSNKGSSSSQDTNTASSTEHQQIALRGFSPEQSTILEARFNEITSTNTGIAIALANLTRQISQLNNQFNRQERQASSSLPILPTTESSPPAQSTAAAAPPAPPPPTS